MSIGFFDSGLGGLSALAEAVGVMPNEHYFYYGDTRNAPYGTKSKEQVQGHVQDAVTYMEQRGIKAVVLACNTATSASAALLRETCGFPVIGMEPAIKPALEHCQPLGKRVLVLATELTVREEKYHLLKLRLDHERLVDSVPASELVTFAEGLDFSSQAVKQYLLRLFSGYDWNRYAAVVLGCTHFIFFKSLIQQLLPDHINVFDGNRGTVRHLRSILMEKGVLASESHTGQATLHFTGELASEKRGWIQDYLKGCGIPITINHQ